MVQWMLTLLTCPHYCGHTNRYVWIIGMYGWIYICDIIYNIYMSNCTELGYIY